MLGNLCCHFLLVENNYWLLLVTCGKTWKLRIKMRRPYHESTLATKLLIWRSLKNFSFLHSPSYKGRKCPCFMEVSLNLSLKRAFSIFFFFGSGICKFLMQMLFFFLFLYTPIPSKHNFPPTTKE